MIKEAYLPQNSQEAKKKKNKQEGSEVPLKGIDPMNQLLSTGPHSKVLPPPNTTTGWGTKPF
jgi:hypothetical protein